ncbi:MAG: flagellar motor switch protein FliM [Limnochordia bacterium]|jgi:flagellar motor switch protein FliM
MAGASTRLTPEEISLLLGARGTIIADSSDAAGATPFDFRRQEKMSKENEQGLRLVQGSFARHLAGSLSTLLRSVVRVEMKELMEGSYEAFTSDLPGTCLMAVCSLSPLEGKILFVLDPELCLVLVDRLMGGQGDAPGHVRELTEIETVLLRRVVERMLGCLQEALGSIVTVKPAIDQMETSPHFVQLASGSDAAVVSTFSMSVRTAEGKVSLCMPYHMLKPIIPRLHEHFWFRDHDKPVDGNAESPQTREHVLHTPVELRAVLGEARISVAELIDLQRGDCIVLDRQEAGELPLLVAGKDRLWGRLGVAGRSYAVVVTRWQDDPPIGSEDEQT